MKSFLEHDVVFAEIDELLASGKLAWVRLTDVEELAPEARERWFEGSGLGWYLILHDFVAAGFDERLKSGFVCGTTCAGEVIPELYLLPHQLDAAFVQLTEKLAL